MASPQSLEEIIRKECLPLRDCMLTITDANGEAAFLYFKEGELIEANYAALWGKEALAQIVALETGRSHRRAAAPGHQAVAVGPDRISAQSRPGRHGQRQNSLLARGRSFNAQKTAPSSPFDRFKAIAGLLKMVQIERGKETVLVRCAECRWRRREHRHGWSSLPSGRNRWATRSVSARAKNGPSTPRDTRSSDLNHDESFIVLLRRKDAFQDDLDAAVERGDRINIMATKLEDALRKVTALPGVKAAFVFDQFHAIIARDVPGQYSNDILKRIASQLYQLALFSWKAKVLTQEFRLVYDKYAVYTRLFAKNFYLVVFMEKNLEPADFRQPLNLSVLVLDRALRTEDVFESNRAMVKVAQLAEHSLKESHEADDSFAGQFRRLCVDLSGPDRPRSGRSRDGGAISFPAPADRGRHAQAARLRAGPRRSIRSSARSSRRNRRFCWKRR